MYVCAAVMKDGALEKSLFHSEGILTPSAIYLDKQGAHRFGHDAIKMARKNPANLVYNVKNVLGLNYCDKIAKLYAERRKPKK